MVIKNRCVACDFVIEADDAMRGHEVVCPNCETLNVLRSADDFSHLREVDRARLDGERRRFLDRLGEGGGARPAPSGGQPWAAGASAEDDAARGLAVLAGRRLKDVSVYVLALAYLVLVLAFVSAALLVVGTALEPILKAFGFLAAATAGVIVFVAFKFASDAVRALADVTDLLRSIDVRLEQVEEGRQRKGVEARARAGDAREAAGERGAG